MAVLVEGISAIIRVQAIHERFPGGWKAFVSKVPNQTLCSDNELARVGFMTPDDCKGFVDHLESVGIIFQQDGHAQDVVVADQMRGFTVPCDWAEFGQIELQPGQTVSAVRIKGATEWQLFCPEGWKYEGSLERFPKRLNLEGFPYGHESDSRFALERRPVWDGEAVFGGFAYARGEGGGGGRHDTGNCGAPRCECQLCGPLS